MTKGIDFEKNAGAGFIIAGYILALMGGVIGLFIGAHLVSTTVKMPDGTMSKKYDARSRKNGIIMLALAVIFAVIWYAILNADY